MNAPLKSRHDQQHDLVLIDVDHPSVSLNHSRRVNETATRGPGRRLILAVGGLIVVASLLLLDTFLRTPGDEDYRILEFARRLDASWFDLVWRILSSRYGMASAWLAIFSFYAVFRRRWLPSLIAALILLVVALFLVTTPIFERDGPDPARLAGAPGSTAQSLPAIEVFVTVLLAGYLVFMSRESAGRAARGALMIGGAVAIAGAGVLALWSGEYWPSHVLAGYALGLAALFGLVWIHVRIENAVGDIPFIRAAKVPHDETAPHAHALTSTILFRDDQAIKIYAPGFVPRAIYWLAFQAEFPYIRNLAALRAAVLRRNLAGRLTEYWYGSNRVARALGIAVVGDRFGIASEYIPQGGEPPDPGEVETFLYDLSARFDQAGLPTWQIDPRQPRGMDNVLQARDGSWHIVDLESGLVSPMASPRAWWRAFWRGDVPLFDTVFFDIMRHYLDREAENMRQKLGEQWLAETRTLLDRTEVATAEWHATEPRVWSRMLRGLLGGFGIRHVAERARSSLGDSFNRAESWVFSAIDEWEQDGRISLQEARRVRNEVVAPRVHHVLPHFGVHLTIGLVTRFPVGSILRASYTLLNFLGAMLLLLFRRITLAQWRERVSMHSPLVILIAGTPGIGTFAYLASGPIRSNHLLIRILLDSVLIKLPFQLYKRTGWRAILARPDTHERDAMRIIPEHLNVFGLRLVPYRVAVRLGMIGVGLVVAGLVFAAVNGLFELSAGWWVTLLGLFDADSNDSIVGWFAGGLLVASVLALAFIALTWRNGHSVRLPLMGLALVLLLPIFDEHMPERIEVISIFQRAVSGGFDDTGDVAAVVVAVALVGVLASTAAWFLYELPEYLRGLFFAALLLYFGGAAGAEVLLHIYVFLDSDLSAIRHVLISLERTFELVGITMLFFAVMEYARWLPLQRRNRAVSGTQ